MVNNSALCNRNYRFMAALVLAYYFLCEHDHQQKERVFKAFKIL